MMNKEWEIKCNGKSSIIKGSPKEILAGLAQIVNSIKSSFLENDVVPKEIIDGILRHAFELGLLSKEELGEKTKQAKEAPIIINIILDKEEAATDENIG